MAGSKQTGKENRIIGILWKIKAIEINTKNQFHLASGKKSPIYIDCRRMLSFPGEREIIVNAAVDTIRGVGIDVLAGCETAGIPLASFLAQKMSLPMVYVRKEAKGHGRGKQIEGILSKGRRVLLCDDLITDGGSKKAFIDAIRKEGCKLEHCLVVFDREQGGKESLAEMGITLHALARLRPALEYGVKEGYIKKRDADIVMGYLERERQS
jgi:orotate phosphoribosyltransferase